MKFLKVLGAAFGVIVLAFLVIGAILPRSYEVSRSTLIAAPPVVVFANVNELTEWPSWSPWAARDPSLRATFAAQTAGVGASYSWVSEKSGSGTLTILESSMPDRVLTGVAFDGQGGGQGELTFVEEAGGTRATWTMRGTMPWPVGGYFVPMMDPMLGKDFSEGLALLKTQSELDARSLSGLGKVAGQAMQQMGAELGKALEGAGQDMARAMEEAARAAAAAGSRFDDAMKAADE